MLNKVKAKYFLKVLFSYVSKYKKLELAKYSKHLQNNLDRRLIHYKIFSERYILYEPDGKRKEYDAYSDVLRFEGEYLNGKRNGKGKEYNFCGSLLFEGEYLNGLKNGKGKEYHDNGKLKFEGEYLNGKRNGKGKDYYWDGELMFEGEFLNGKRNGKGKEYDHDGNLIFEGEYLDGAKFLHF